MPKSKNRKNHKQKLAAYRQQMSHAKNKWQKMLKGSTEPITIVPNPSIINLTESENNSTYE
jgi:hypothetical protein